MNARRSGMFATMTAAGILGLASVAWACVPGHDHMTPEEAAAHNATPVAPVAAPPPAAPAPAPVVESPTAAPIQAQTETAPAPEPEPAPVARTAPAPTRTAVAPVRTAVPAAPAPAAPAPPVAAAPVAAPAASLVTTAPEVLPATPAVPNEWADAGTAEPAAATTSDGSSRQALGYAVLGLGIVLLLAVLGSAFAGWRGNAGPPALAD